MRLVGAGLSHEEALSLGWTDVVWQARRVHVVGSRERSVQVIRSGPYTPRPRQVRGLMPFPDLRNVTDRFASQTLTAHSALMVPSLPLVVRETVNPAFRGFEYLVATKKANWYIVLAANREGFHGH